MKKQLVFLLILTAIVALASCKTPRERAEELLAKMTLQEKLSYVHGNDRNFAFKGKRGLRAKWGQDGYVGQVSNISRLGIPSINLEDGPQGVADAVLNVTVFPSALTVVATWDTDLMYEFAKAMAQEQKIKGTNVALGPMVNIARVPVGGRNFESFGEDPFLASQMVKPYVKGIQDQGVLACVKHFANNNQEADRLKVSANVELRPQWEIYYPAFEAAIQAGVGSVMCAYNRVNNSYACENEQLYKDLKSTMGFEGFVVSDWGATMSTVRSANAGLDMEMPDSEFYGKALANAIHKGEVSEARLNDMILRILTPMFAVGIFDSVQPYGDLHNDARSPVRSQLSRKLAAAATVLLKNDDSTLPLQVLKYKRVAVIGDDAQDKPMIAGGGSGFVNGSTSVIITPLQAIRSEFATRARVSYVNSSNIDAAVTSAQNSDIALVFVSAFSSEGEDRVTLALPNNQDALVSAVARVAPLTIVVYHGPAANLMPWHTNVKSIICGFFPGQEIGPAVADVLFGRVNPSGRLPVTFPMTDAQVPVHSKEQYPGIHHEQSYSEGLLVGYRWYDAKKIEPLYPFGHGLSYTTFGYGNLTITRSAQSEIKVSKNGALLKSVYTITATVTNTGSVNGAEVAQLYLGFPEASGEPPMQLKGFKKVQVPVQKTQTVTFQLSQRDISIYNVEMGQWVVPQGTFNVYVGASSRDIRLKGTFNAI